MCLRAQGIDNDDVSVGEGRLAQGLSDNNKGVGGVPGIDDATEGMERTKEAARIRGRRQRLRRCNDGTDELATTMEASEEEDEPEDSTTETEASAEEAEETMRPSECL